MYFPSDPAQILSVVAPISDKGCRNTTFHHRGARSFTSHGTFQLNLCKLSRQVCVRLTQVRVQGRDTDPESIHWAKTESGGGDLRLQKFQKPVAGAAGRRFQTTREGTRVSECPGLGSSCTTPRDSAWLAPPGPCSVSHIGRTSSQDFLLSLLQQKPFMPTDLLAHPSVPRLCPSLFPTPYCLG